MRCPHCQTDSEDAASECPKCGFNFDKWRKGKAAPAAAPQASAVAAPAPSAPAHEGWSLWIWLALLAGTLGVWQLSRMEEAGAAPAEGAFPGRRIAAQEKAGAKDSWHFEGAVKDLARDSPVKGAKVRFSDFETGNVYEAESDDDGRYAVDVPIRPKFGYSVAIANPIYAPRVWPGSALRAARAERLRMGLLSPDANAETPFYRGAAGKSAPLDFAIFPLELTDEEKQAAEQ